MTTLGENVHLSNRVKASQIHILICEDFHKIVLLNASAECVLCLMQCLSYVSCKQKSLSDNASLLRKHFKTVK